jgi:hypothetical protein
MSKKNLIRTNIEINVLKPTFTSVFEDNMSLRRNKKLEIMVNFNFFCLLMEGAGTGFGS